MRAQKTQSGYTIIETLIVLAVTGAMFVVTVVLVSGQIARYQFRSGVLNAQQGIQSALNDVQTGYFSLANATTAPCDSGSNSAPGDSDCVYIGKIFSISSTGELTSRPIIADIDSSSPIGQPITNLLALDNPEVTQLPQNVDYYDSPLAPSGFLVLYTNYPNGSITTFTGGAQAVGVFGQDGSGNVAEVVGSGKVVCVQNGTRKAALSIGANRSLNVDVNYQPTAAECP